MPAPPDYHSTRLLWSNKENTETPEEKETLESSHFDPFLQFIRNPYEEAKAEYYEILDVHVGEMQ